MEYLSFARANSHSSAPAGHKKLARRRDKRNVVQKYGQLHGQSRSSDAWAVRPETRKDNHGIAGSFARNSIFILSICRTFTTSCGPLDGLHIGYMCEAEIIEQSPRGSSGTRGTSGPPPVPFCETGGMFKHIAQRGRVRRVLISSRLVELEGGCLDLIVRNDPKPQRGCS